MKIPRGFRMYVIVTQYLVLAAFLTYLGYYFGKKIDLARGDSDFFSFILGLLGIVIGLSVFIMNIMKVKNEPQRRN